jgi:hypothetical protein
VRLTKNIFTAKGVILTFFAYKIWICPFDSMRVAALSFLLFLNSNFLQNILIIIFYYNKFSNKVHHYYFIDNASWFFLGVVFFALSSFHSIATIY